MGDAVLEAGEGAGRARGARRVEEAVDPPPGAQHPARLTRQIPDHVHHRVRVLRADLHRKVAVAARLVQLVARERGHGHQPRRSPPGQPEAVVEQRGPTPTVTVRRSCGPLTAATSVSTGVIPAVSALARRVRSFRSTASSFWFRHPTSYARNAAKGCCGVRTPA
ncbi:hypothetical protein Sfulv_03170 [Streptomyces fulvorobeus]|uniref:Uncharacterized protein n=1 Tax=Streptomyces fulvorobeus TaxID=284028 RepID=A0A7J0C188_9ACTN|nr:hypothetical protein Sfulv_03170 [Streptomyces fulvorobeus]